MWYILFHLGEVVGEVQDVLHQVPAEREGQLLGGNKFDKTKTKKDQKEGLTRWESGNLGWRGCKQSNHILA